MWECVKRIGSAMFKVRIANVINGTIIAGKRDNV
jgi:hypothetical protein